MSQPEHKKIINFERALTEKKAGDLSKNIEETKAALQSSLLDHLKAHLVLSKGESS